MSTATEIRAEFSFTPHCTHGKADIGLFAVMTPTTKCTYLGREYVCPTCGNKVWIDTYIQTEGSDRKVRP